MKSIRKFKFCQGHALWKWLQLTRSLALAALIAGESGFAATGASIEKGPEDYNARLQESAKFSVTTFPPAAVVRWYKVGKVKPLAMGREFKIDKVEVSDVGYYYCTVGEDEAAVSSSAALMVSGPEDRVEKSEGKERILSVTVPVSVPYPGTGYGTTGPCGPYVGVVRFAKPGSNPPNYNWVSPNGRIKSLSLEDVTVGGAGFQTSLSIIQNYPPIQRCTKGSGPLEVPVIQGCGYSLWTYVVGPANFSGSVINAKITWNTLDR